MVIFISDSVVLGSGFSLRYVYDFKYAEFTCADLRSGLIVKIHPADEIPNFLHDVHTIQSFEFHENIQFELRPKVIKISEGLAKVNPEL